MGGSPSIRSTSSGRTDRRDSRRAGLRDGLAALFQAAPRLGPYVAARVAVGRLPQRRDPEPVRISGAITRSLRPVHHGASVRLVVDCPANSDTLPYTS